MPATARVDRFSTLIFGYTIYISFTDKIFYSKTHQVTVALSVVVAAAAVGEKKSVGG